MKSSITTTTDSQKTISVELTEADLAPTVSHTFDHLRTKVTAAGFRPGKAPNHIVERELGEAAVQAEVIDAALSASFPEALAKNEVTPIAQPKVEVTKFVPYTELTYNVVVEILPPIKLADYKKLKKKQPQAKVEAKEVDQAVEDLQKRLSSTESVERAAKAGDELQIDFAGSQDGESVAGAQGKDHKIVIGSNTFIPGFEDELIGLKKGDEKTFDITFPKEYHEPKLAGAVVQFKVNVTSVSEVVLPELNDAFAADAAGLKTLKELKADLESRLQAEKQAEAMRQYENELLEDIIKKSTLTLPEALVEQQIEHLRSEFAQQLASSGMDIDKWLGLTGKNLEQFNDELKPKAEQRVAAGLVMSEIAKAEKIEVSEAEVDAELAQLSTMYPDPAMQAELAKPEMRSDLRSHLMTGRTLAKLVEYASSK